MRYAVVNANGDVENIVEWDGVSKWAPPAGCTAVPDPDLASQMRGRWDGARFHPAPPRPREPEPGPEEYPVRALEARIAALEALAKVR